MSVTRRPGLVFDLDGTLIDSAPAIMAVGNRLLAEHDLPPLTLGEARSYIGNGAAKFVERALTARGVKDASAGLKETVERFEVLYAEADPNDNVPMPDVDPVLRTLSEEGFSFALCTNKPGIPTQTVIAAMGWSDLFAAIVSGDSLPVNKPDPAPLIEAQRLLGTRSIIFLGDSEVDAETAKRGAIPFLLYTEGYRKSPLDTLPHRAAFSQFKDLPALLYSVLETMG